MRTRLPLLLAVTLALAAGSAAAQPTGEAAAKAVPGAPTKAVPAKAGSTTRPAASRAAKTTAPARTKSASAAPRTLSDITIEGEIPVPQVLFITARDQRRFMDLHHRRYLMSSVEIGERTVLPTTLTVIRKPTSGARKETSP